MEDLAYSRIQESLSKGENFKKLLKLHISPYIESVDFLKKLENLKNVDYAEGAFLEWIGQIKGAVRPFTEFGATSMTDFYAWSFEGEEPQNQGLLTFATTQAEPFFFNNIKYYKVSDANYKKIVKVYCMLTNFTGTIEEYELFFQTIFGINVKIRLRESDFNLEFQILSTATTAVDRLQIKSLTPTLPQVENIFLESAYSQISFGFDNIEGIGWNFNGLDLRSLTFNFKG